jgi:hypothetical protein
MEALFSAPSQRATFGRRHCQAGVEMSSEAPDLLRLSAEELDTLFRSADA